MKELAARRQMQGSLFQRELTAECVLAPRSVRKKVVSDSVSESEMGALDFVRH